MRLIISVGTLALMSVLGTACGKGFAVKSLDTEAKNLTGAQNKNGVPYTGASSGQDLENLKQAVDPSSKANLDFAASIESAVINRLDLAGNASATAPAKLQIRIQFHAGKPVTYNAVLNSSREARAVTSADDAAATKVNARCLDADCTSVEVRMTTSGSAASAAEAGFIYRVRAVSLQVLGPFAPATAATTRLAQVNSLITAAASPMMTTTEVAWGPATFDLRAGDVQASGDLVATGGAEQNVSVQIKNDSAIKGLLIGNSNRGELLLRITDESAWMFVRIRVPVSATNNSANSDDTDDSNDDPKVPVANDDTPSGERYIPFDTSNPITAVFQRDLNNSVIQDAIKVVTTGDRAADMRKFLDRARLNLPVMLDGLKTQSIPPELVFLTFVESPFFYSNYDLSISKAGAVGPWQFMPPTAEGFGLRVFDPLVVPSRVVNGKQKFKYVVNPCDQRANLDLSSKAAARYLRVLFNAFHDPKLAVMAYNMGAGKMNMRLNKVNQKLKEASACGGDAAKICDYDVAKLTYWDVRNMHLAGVPQESINYVPQFLAAQFVGREPLRYGIKVATTGFPPAPTPVCK